MIVKISSKLCQAIFKGLLVRDRQGIKSILIGRGRRVDRCLLINIGLLRLKLLALGAVNCKAGWHWRSDFRNILNWWLEWHRWGLERLECTVALLD